MEASQGHQQGEQDDRFVSNGTIDIHGRLADKKRTGGWKASPFIIVNEVAERLAFFAIAVNMVSYLVLEMHQSIPEAATHVTDWIGAAYVLTLLGAFVADAYLGRFFTIIVFSSIYTVGMILLTLSASIDSLRPSCIKGVCKSASTHQTLFLYGALGLIALGTGGIKPCVSSFGADQFDEKDPKEMPKKYSFFNWFFFAINMGALLGITLLVYVEQRKGWRWGFGVPTVSMVCSILILAAGIPFYRYQKPMGSAFTRFAQVTVASIRNHMQGVRVDEGVELYEVNSRESAIVGARKLPRTRQYRFLDKAAIVTGYQEASNTSRWRLCTVTQVEEFKCFVRVLPVWASTIALSISFAQISTFFISQSTLMNRKLAPHFAIPPGSVPIFSATAPLILVPLYEHVIVPLLRACTGNRRGLTSLQRMGVGLFISIFALIAAALVEKRRVHEARGGTKMSVFWLFPQFFLLGSAEVFTYVGQLEFFYDAATDGTRSLSSAMFLSEVGIGSWLSTVIVKTVNQVTGGEHRGWLRGTLNSSRLDYFYWLLAVINAVNFIVYLFVAWSYKGRSGNDGSMEVEAIVDNKEQGKFEKGEKI